MYAYFYIDKNDNLAECDRDTYKKWEFSLTQKWHDHNAFFYIRDRQVCVECPPACAEYSYGSDLYSRLEDKYGEGITVMDSEFSVKDKNYTIVTDISAEYYFTGDDDSFRGFYGYYPGFETIARCYSSGDYSGQLYKITDCPNYGLEKAIEYHESVILDIVSGKDLKYIS